MRPLTTDCDVLDFADELRTAQSAARRQLAPGAAHRDALVAEVVAAYFREARGPHGGGFAAAPAGFGGRRWHFECRCGARAQRLYRPIGWTRYACRRCAGTRYPDARRHEHLTGLFPLVAELDAWNRRAGRRPRRYHRAVASAWRLIGTGKDLFAAPGVGR